MRHARPFAFLAAVVLAPSLPAAEKDVETKLPDRAENVHVAGGGKFLVMKVRGVRGLTVYEAATQKLTTIDLPDEDFTYGAGGDAAVVYIREKNELRSYDVATGKLLKSKEFVDQPRIVGFLMGHSRGDLALVHMGRDPMTGNAQPNAFLDVAELRMKPNKTPFPMGQRFGYDGLHLRTNGDLSRITEWATSVSPNGIGLYTRTADGVYTYAHAHDSAGTLVPGDDGLVYTGYGAVLELEPNFNPNTGHTPFRRSEPKRGQTLLPALGGQFTIGLTRAGGLTLYTGAKLDSVCPLDDFPSWGGPKVRNPNFDPNDFGPGAQENDSRTPISTDKRVCFAPAHGHILFVPPGNEKVVYRKFDLKAVLDKTGEHYLLVASVAPVRAKGGAAWEYQVQPVAKHEPVKYELTRAPEGMAVTAAGKITWTPQKGVIGRAPVELKVTDAKDNVVRQTFEVNFE